jgi:uncharacterized protein (DUF433 family)
MTAISTPTKNYVEYRNQGYWIVGTRISLDSVVYDFLSGSSPENIQQNFPLLSLEQVYGGIAFYLANREQIDAYLQQELGEFDKLQLSLRKKNPLLFQKLTTAKAQKQNKKSVNFTNELDLKHNVSDHNHL